MTLALTIGEPAGIGPDIVLQLSQQQPALFSRDKIIIIGNKELLAERADTLNIKINFNQLSIIDIPLADPCIPGKLNLNNSQFVIDMLTFAAANCLSKNSRASLLALFTKVLLTTRDFNSKVTPISFHATLKKKR